MYMSQPYLPLTNCGHEMRGMEAVLDCRDWSMKLGSSRRFRSSVLGIKFQSLPFEELSRSKKFDRLEGFSLVEY